MFMSFACAYLCLCTMFIHNACKIQNMVVLLELELAVSCHIGADYPTQVILKQPVLSTMELSLQLHKWPVFIYMYSIFKHMVF